MPELMLRAVRKKFGARGPEILKGIDLTVDSGEMLVLLGPSGCGKTTLLRCIAGLETPSAGTIEGGGSVLFDADRHIDVPTERRKTGMVFQQYALWPHMTIGRIVEYPLRMHGVPKEERQERVLEVAQLVDCEELLSRYPSSLSGGQQQRIALARALVAAPDFVLFDEPLSNLDAKLRETLRVEIRELHRRSGFTGVYVTHDQSEAFAIADRVAVMRGGEIQQLDSPETVWSQPATEWVADFVGASNRLPVDEATLWFGETPAATCIAEWVSAGAAAIRTRPHEVALSAAGAQVSTTRAHEELVLEGAILRTVVFSGTEIDYSLEWPDGSRWRAKGRSTPEALHGRETLREGAAVTVRVPKASLLPYDPGGRLMGEACRSAGEGSADDQHNGRHANAR